MTPRDLPPDDSTSSDGTSRRSVLRLLTVGPVAVSVGVAAPWSEALASLHQEQGDEPALLSRSRENRRLSRVRYHRAESFFAGIEQGAALHREPLLYQAGIVAQLALSAHLLDIGFEDQWCARHIGLRVAKALAYGNATGLGHDDADMARLAAVLTPYWKWNAPRLWGEPIPDNGGFTADQVRPLLRALLERIHEVTGHPRPSGRRKRIGKEADA